MVSALPLCCWGFGDFGLWGEGAEGRVEGDFFDGLGRGGFGFEGAGAGEIEAGDLEAVEQETGATRVDVVGSNLLEHLAYRELDGAAVFRQWQGEGGAAAAAGPRVLGRAARGVMEVAEILWITAASSSGFAEAGAQAAGGRR